MRRCECLLFFCWCAMALHAAETTWNFDADKSGAPPTGFTAGAGEWRIAADDAAPSKPHVVAQTAKSDDSVFNVLLADGASFKNVELSVKFKSVAGETDQGGGVVWRARDAQNYYIARYNPLEFNFRLYHVVDGKRTQLRDAKQIKLTPDWHTLRIVMKGDKIEGFLDGTKHWEASDATFKDAGKIGLWTKADAQTSFDDLTASGE